MAQEQVILPTTVSDFSDFFKDCGSLSNILRYCKEPSKLRPDQLEAWRNSGWALVTGRPLGSAMIFMAGPSGAGKSSTINALFDDTTICASSSMRSQTKDPVLVQKQLCVIQKESLSVVGKLSFVDVPGTFDTDSRNEVINLASIRNFTESRIELASRAELSSQISKQYFNFSPTVYPNMILFVVKATDNRMAGPDSTFRKSLCLFKETANLVDTNNPNVIIVLTHAASIARKKERFISILAEKTASVREIVYEVLGITNVPVVPVENDGEGQELEMDQGFYRLPNGERSHYNLFETMLKMFEKNKDLIGKLLVSWYYHPNCPEKHQKAEVIQSSRKLTEDELARAARSLHQLKMPGAEEYLHKALHFDTLGFGYCPVTEEVKDSLLHESGSGQDEDPSKQKNITIQGVKYSIPCSVTPFIGKTSSFHRLTFYDKNEYQGHMKASYGIEAGFKLAVSGDSYGRWVNDASSDYKSSLVSLTQEIQLARFRLNNPREQVKCSRFWRELRSLPDFYNQYCARSFQCFFSKWGSHLVCEQAIGGAVTLNCTMQVASVTRDKLQQVEAHVSAIFKGFSGSAEGAHQVHIQGLKSTGISNEHLKIQGGDPPSIVTLESMNPQMMEEWSKTVAEDPAGLRKSIKLYPYFNLVDGARSASLRQATADYLADTLDAKLNTVFEKTKAQASEKAVNEVFTSPPPAGCFPRGTLIHLSNGSTEPIEKLGCLDPRQNPLKTISFEMKNPFRGIMKLGSEKPTEFCTFLDFQREQELEYLVLQFSNGKKLIVSEGHIIFQYIPNDGDQGLVMGKQAKDFQVGEMAIYCAVDKDDVETPEIVKITKENHVGAFAPLTMSGTFIADGFLVSSYANTSSFAVAQAATLPLKIWCKMRNNGKKAFIGNEKLNQEGAAVEKVEGIHPFAHFLISLRNAITYFIPKHLIKKNNYKC